MSEKTKKPRDWKLIDRIIAHSKADDWDAAKNEWKIIDYYESDDETCICGQEHISHCHTLENMETGDKVGPIGSSCIEKFDSVVMNDDMDLAKSFVTLNKAFDNFVNIDDIKTPLRNRKLMAHLTENGVLGDRVASDFYGKMIRKTTPMTEKQEKWLRKIVFFDVKPYVQDQIKDYHTHLVTPEKSDKVMQKDMQLAHHIISLNTEFSNPTTTLRALYPHLKDEGVREYLNDSGAFSDDRNKNFFNSIIDKGGEISPKQSQWFKSIISGQIKPFILDKAETFMNNLSLDRVDLDLETDELQI